MDAQKEKKRLKKKIPRVQYGRDRVICSLPLASEHMANPCSLQAQHVEAQLHVRFRAVFAFAFGARQLLPRRGRSRSRFQAPGTGENVDRHETEGLSAPAL